MPCAERGVAVSHTSIYRWVQRYVPEYERRWSRYAKPVDPSWRVDETAISIRGGSRYLYRAVDKFGKTVDFVGDNRAIFDLGGNKYRLIVHATYRYKRVLVKFVGTHAEYDKIDPVTCEVK